MSRPRRLVELARNRLRRQPTPPAIDGERPTAGLDHPTVSPGDREIIRRARPYTMTGPLRLQALVDAVRYCSRRGLPGGFAECGVWRGGSVLAMILALQELGEERDIYLYDTFEGMTEPGEHDVSCFDSAAVRTWRDAERAGTRPWGDLFDPTEVNEEAVRRLLLGTGYAEHRLHFVRGSVLETLPARGPTQLALLRLDTDWYDSTKHELVHLYPTLIGGGVLIVDDYGHWEGARRAVDEYFESTGTHLLLNRIDYTARIAVKH